MENKDRMINNRYRIEKELGAGGMAVVYEAYDTRLERKVAIKVIGIEESTPEKVIRQFEKESRALARLNHPNIIPILDYGKSENSLYLVMPLIEGGTLKERMGKPMGAEEAAALLAPIGRALAYAHGQNIIHRDVKPSNILITAGGVPMLSDFGIAKVLEEAETVEMTGTMQTTGTPEYMSPESGLGKATTPAADIYSLGVILFEAVTGKKPFVADGALAIIHKQAYEALPRPSGVNRGVPGYLDGVIYKAMAKEPVERYGDMGEFAEVLEQIAGGKRVRVAAAQPRGKEKGREIRGSRVWIGGAIGVIVIGLIGIGYVQQGGIGMVGEETGTSVPTVIPTETLTPTPAPTETPTPTMTPTISYPVDLGTPYPTPQEMIGVENIDRLTKLAEGGYGLPLQVSFSVDDKQLFVCTQLGIVIYDVEDFRRKKFIESNSINTVCAFSRSEYLLAIADENNKISIWDLVSGELVKEIPTKLDLTDILFSPTAKLILASGWTSGECKTVVWEIENGTIKFINHRCGSAAITLDEQSILLGNGQSLEYWNIAQNSVKKTSFIKNGENIHLSKDGTLLITIQSNVSYYQDTNGIIYIHELSDLNQQRQFEIPNMGPQLPDNFSYYNDYFGQTFYREPFLIPFSITSEGSRMAIGNSDGSILVLDAATGYVMDSISEKWTGSVDLSNSGTRIAYSSILDGSVNVYDLQRHDLITLTNFSAPYSIIKDSNLNQASIFEQYESNGHKLLSPLFTDIDWGGADESGFRQYVRLRVDPGENIFSYRSLTDDPFWDTELHNSKTGMYLRFLISPDKEYMATTDGFSVELWKKPEEGWVKSSPTDLVATRITYYAHARGALVFSNDSQFFADIKDSKATVWRLQDFTPIIEIKESDGTFRFSRDSKLIAWITKNNISFFSTETGEQISTIVIDSNPFIFSPKMDVCVVMKVEETYIFSVADGSLILQIPNKRSENSLFEFSEDQRYLLVGNPLGMLEIWGIPSK